MVHGCSDLVSGLQPLLWFPTLKKKKICFNGDGFSCWWPDMHVSVAGGTLLPVPSGGSVQGPLETTLLNRISDSSQQAWLTSFGGVGWHISYRKPRILHLSRKTSNSRRVSVSPTLSAPLPSLPCSQWYSDYLRETRAHPFVSSNSPASGPATLLLHPLGLQAIDTRHSHFSWRTHLLPGTTTWSQ